MSTVVFIDGSNLFATIKAMRWSVDYKKLRDWIVKEFDPVGMYYYTALRDAPDNSVVKLADWLQYNGYRVKSKPAKEWVDASGTLKVKGNMDMEMAVDAMLMAEKGNNINHMVFFTGDGDFRCVVEAIQNKGVTVSIVSSINPAMVADELRRQADAFVDLNEFKDLIGKPFVRDARTVNEFGS